MKKFTILGAGWLGLKVANSFKNYYQILLSSRNIEKESFYKNLGFDSFVLNENNFDYLDELLNTNYLFINYPPSSFENYLNFLNKIYSNKNISNIKKIIFISSTSVYPNQDGKFDENYIIDNPKSQIVFNAEEIIKNKTNIILRAAGLVGYDRYFGKNLKNNTIDFKNSPVNFVHADDVVKATNFLIKNNIDGLFNLCSKNHPSKKNIYDFNAKKYNMQSFIYSSNEDAINRIIDGSKITTYGFTYDHENPFC